MIVAIYLMLSILMSLLSIVFTDYIYGEVDQEFKNDFTFDIRFEVFHSRWMGLYAADTSGIKLSMMSESSNSDDTIQLVCNFNGRKFDLTLKGFQGKYDSGYLGMLFKMRLSITNNNLYHHLDHVSNAETLLISNLFVGGKIKSEAFSEFPSVRNFTKNERKIFIWIGSIERNKYGQSNKTIGCIIRLHVNNKSIKWVSRGEYFSYPCEKRVSQSICYREKCHNKSIGYHILDCQSAVMNTMKHCWEDLSSDALQINAYIVAKPSIKSTMITLAWRQHLRNKCLLEIVSRNGNVILFHTNDYDEVVMCHGIYGSMDCNKKIWQKISVNMIYVLLIEWSGTEMTVKISDGGDINTFIDEIIEYPQLVNVGFSLQSVMCKTFYGEMAFRYNTSQMKHLISIKHSITTPNNTMVTSTNQITAESICKIYPWKIILPWTLFVSSVVLICIFCVCMRCYQRMKNAPIPTLNLYEEHVQLPEIPLLMISPNPQSHEATYEYVS